MVERAHSVDFSQFKTNDPGLLISHFRILLPRATFITCF
jgi:hypothetical protein